MKALLKRLTDLTLPAFSKTEVFLSHGNGIQNPIVFCRSRLLNLKELRYTVGHEPNRQRPTQI
jgi:hypothetical protein